MRGEMESEKGGEGRWGDVGGKGGQMRGEGDEGRGFIEGRWERREK